MYVILKNYLKDRYNIKRGKKTVYKNLTAKEAKELGDMLNEYAEKELK